MDIPAIAGAAARWNLSDFCESTLSPSMQELRMFRPWLCSLTTVLTAVLASGCQRGHSKVTPDAIHALCADPTPLQVLFGTGRHRNPLEDFKLLRNVVKRPGWTALDIHHVVNPRWGIVDDEYQYALLLSYQGVLPRDRPVALDSPTLCAIYILGAMGPGGVTAFRTRRGEVRFDGDRIDVSAEPGDLILSTRRSDPSMDAVTFGLDMD